jgi:hypothetical protein
MPPRDEHQLETITTKLLPEDPQVFPVLLVPFQRDQRAVEVRSEYMRGEEHGGREMAGTCV